MTHTMHTDIHQPDNHKTFLQRAKARITAMRQTAEEVTEELALTPEAKYEILSIIYNTREADHTHNIILESIVKYPRNTISNDLNINVTLEEVDKLIIEFTRKIIYCFTPHPEWKQDEIDELAQMVRIKLWRALQTKHIMSLKPYIYAIVRNEYIRILRNRKMVLPLALDAEGELYQGDLLILPSKGMRDPAYEVDAQIVDPDTLECITTTIEALPSRQQYALICYLKDNDDGLVLITSLQHLHVDPKTVHWPEEKTERHRLRASLAIARKKIQSGLSV